MRWQMENGKSVVNRAEPWKMAGRAAFFLRIFFLPFAVCHLTGCNSSEPTTQPSSLSARQDEALKDPMGYKVPPNQGVSNGDTTGFDKSGFQKDLNDVLNP